MSLSIKLTDAGLATVSGGGETEPLADVGEEHDYRNSLR